MLPAQLSSLVEHPFNLEGSRAFAGIVLAVIAVGGLSSDRPGLSTASSGPLAGGSCYSPDWHLPSRRAFPSLCARFLRDLLQLFYPASE